MKPSLHSFLINCNNFPINSGAGPGTGRGTARENFRLDPDPGEEIFLKMTLYNAINGPKIVLKSIKCHLGPVPVGKFSLNMTKYFYMKIKKMRIP